MKKKASTKGLKRTEVNTIKPNLINSNTKVIKKTEKKSFSVIQSLLGDIAFAVNNTEHSSIITTLTKCHKDILNIKKDVGIAN